MCLACTLRIEGESPKLVLPRLATKYHPLAARNPRGAVSTSRGGVVGEADQKIVIVIVFVIIVGPSTIIELRPIVAVDDEDASRPSSFRVPPVAAVLLVRTACNLEDPLALLLGSRGLVLVAAEPGARVT